MSKLPVDPYDRTVIVEPDLDTPDRAPLAGTGRDFVVSLLPEEAPGRVMKFLNSAGEWVPFTTTEFTSWGGILGDIEDQADLQAALALKANGADISAVGYTGIYNDLLSKPTFGNLAFINTNGATSQFLRGDGNWAIPVDVNAQWGNIAGSIAAQTDLVFQLAFKAPLANPIFTGNPRTSTPPVVDNDSDSLSTTGWFFGQAFNATPVMDGAASSGNSTFWARGNHRHPTDTTLAPLDSPQLIGLPVAPTPTTGNNSQRIATTAFVAAALASSIPEAPIDSRQYARKDAAWAEVVASSGAGRIFYYDPTDNSDISGYKRMLASPSVNAESTLVAACTGVTDFLLASFATDVGIPGAGVYPTGTAYRRVYAKVSSGTAKLHLQIYIRNAAGVETLVRDEFSPDFINQTATLQEWLASMPYGGTLLATDRLVSKLYAQRVAGGAGGVVTVTAYFEGTTNVSHIQTTIPGGTASGAGGAALDAITPATANDANLVGFRPASGSGKAINITAGAAAAASGATFAGGAVNIAGGGPGAAGSTGGAVSILSGAGTSTAPSGAITIKAGAGTPGVGLVKIQGGDATTAVAGAVSVIGGTAGPTGTSTGGLLTLSGGPNGAVAGSKGGSVAIVVPDSLGAPGGSLTLAGGAAGNVSFGNGPVGGDITLLAGKGGNNTNSFAAGIGGAISLTAGAGGTPQSGTSSAGVGGAVAIRAGAGGGTVGNGGDVTIQGGAASGTGVKGKVIVGDAVFTGTVTGIPVFAPPPSDGQTYGYKDGAWVVISSYWG